MPKILIAAPVFQRDWVLPYWFKAIENQNFPMEDIGLIFNLGPDDDATHDVIWEWSQKHPELFYFDAQIFMHVNHSSHAEGSRQWNQSKYYNMVKLRNDLLERADAISDRFDFYFSLDSDLLLEDPETLNKLVAYAEEDPLRSVISPLSYMTPYDTNFPSAMTWTIEGEPSRRAKRNHSRYEIGKLFKADIVMAAVFMQKYVVKNIRYQWHWLGEDLGFATALNEAGYHSYAAWDIYCPHIMSRQFLAHYLKNGVDSRKPQIFI